MAAATSGAPFRTLLLGTLNSDGTVTGITTGTSKARDCSAYPYLTLYITASAAISAGTMILEEADYDPNTQIPFSGTWSTIATLNLVSLFTSAGGQSGQHQVVSQYAYVRARIGTTVTGGTIIAVLRGC